MVKTVKGSEYYILQVGGSFIMASMMDSISAT
jgi:hypothetical protein